MLVWSNSVIQCMLYIFLNEYVLPYIFPNHAFNWECSKVEQSFIWKMFSNEKNGDLFPWEIILCLLLTLNFWYYVIPLIYFIETFCWWQKEGEVMVGC